MGVRQSTDTTGKEKEQELFLLHCKELYADLTGPGSTLNFKDRFVSLFGGPSMELGNKLYSYLLDGQDVSRSTKLKVVDYDSFALTIFKLKDVVLQYSEASSFFFKLFCNCDSKNLEADLEKMLHAAASCALYIGLSERIAVPATHPFFSAIISAIMQHYKLQREEFSVSQFSKWVALHCPHLFTGLCQWLYVLLLPVSARKDTYRLPFVDCKEEERQFDFNILIWVLSCVLPTVFMGAIQHHEKLPVGGLWTCLYSSRDHGFSMNRFQHHCFNYKQPSVMILDCYSTKENQTYRLALAMDSEWRDGIYFYGGVDFHLIQLLPTFSLIKKGARLVSLNEKQRGFPCGLRVMASEKYKYCLLEVMASLDQARLMEGEWMQVQLIEVWGCGGVEGMESQQKIKELEAKDIQRRREISNKERRDAWMDSPDRYLLEQGGVTTSRPTEQPL